MRCAARHDRFAAEVHVTYLAEPMRLDNRPASRAAMLLALIIYQLAPMP
jgi:hypothetical protein